MKANEVKEHGSETGILCNYSICNSWFGCGANHNYVILKELLHYSNETLFFVAFLNFSHENILNAGPIQSTYWAIKLNKNSCSIQFNTSNDNATLDELLHGSETCELLVASISKRVVTKEKTPNNDIFSQKKHTSLFHLPMVLQAEVSNSSNSENCNSKDDTNNSSSRWTTWS